MNPIVRRQTIADALRRSALRMPAKTAIVCGATRWTYAEFDALCTRLAAGLAAARHRQGDRVAVLARNSHGFAALRFALARLGAVLVPINFMLNAEEVAFILRHAGARRWPRQRPGRPGARRGGAGHGGGATSSGCRRRPERARRRHGELR